MGARLIVFWSVAVIGGAFAWGALAAAGLSGLIVAIPAMFAVPHVMRLWRFEWSVRRELRSWLRGRN